MNAPLVVMSHLLAITGTLAPTYLMREPCRNRATLWNFFSGGPPPEVESRALHFGGQRGESLARRNHSITCRTQER